MPDQFDRDLANSEQLVSQLALKELLYGGPGGDGLIPTVKQLVKSVDKFANLIEGDNGFRDRLIRAERDLSDLKKDISKRRDDFERRVTVFFSVFGLTIFGLIVDAFARHSP